MIQISTAQWYAWISAFIFPFLRIFGLILAEPMLGNRIVAVPAKIGLAIFLTLLIVPLVPAMPNVAPASAQGISIAVQQLLIGLAMGFVFRIALTAAEMAGHLAGLQMGLGFAVFFDPQTSAQTAVVGQFVGLFSTLIFLSLNGHFVVLSALVESFRALPVALEPVHAIGWRNLVAWAGVIFSTGLLIALPIVAALLVANIAVGIMSRAAPQLNIFAVGFPITLAVGLLALYFAAPSMGLTLSRLFEEAFSAIPRLLDSFAGR